ncbi:MULTISPECIES: YcfL family protein [Nitratiruptor]|uniref:Predicted periplasmic lipoprotein n=1 Tax=Nitratiruptor tergarcus DSM 16512 TaxID=1069081 RepID=A0A1W1WR37_9BACT|nr:MULTISPECIES: YcfL family protein [Nitratiruptor]BCD61264.1 hypothetical protein NitYY0813_C0098 [Nitratiruptor sp. YY08-13]BCD65197.1 hypothetical protein NitYY0826_C0098 [Nitratiruptor sp. YY08-26]SMC08774.1 Predicted periplasmic lipoprotein [Nitratiruptor tergarcus DSM 16512]
MNIKTLKIWSIIAVLILSTGCAPSTYPAHKSASNVLKSISNEYIINNIPLDYKVSIVSYNSKYTNDLLHVSVDIKNHKQEQYELEYRFRWFDDTGFEVDATPWLPLTLNAMEYKTIQGIAHSPQVESFKFYIRVKQ